MTIGYYYSEEIIEICEKLDKLGGEVNCHDGTFDAFDLLEHAEVIVPLLTRYLELKRTWKSVFIGWERRDIWIIIYLVTCFLYVVWLLPLYYLGLCLFQKSH